MALDTNRQPEDDHTSGMTRRNLVVAGAASALLVTPLAGLLEACGGSSPSGTTTGGTPQRGGILRFGAVSGGHAETLVPTSFYMVDVLRTNLLYDPLFRLANDLRSVVPQLAQSAEPNKTASVWTFKLRDGVRWHDGKPFTADDVVYTMRSWQSKNSQTFGAFNGIIDYKRVRARDPLTVEVPLLHPFGEFPKLVTSQPSAYIVQAGSTPKSLNAKGIGTGPFKYVSFTPGQRSVFDRNPDYWQHGKPYVDQAIVDSSFTDETARMNALLAGELDILPLLSPVQANQLTSSSSAKLLRSNSPLPTVFYMNTKRAPFTDVRVRQAFRLLVDRPAIVEGAFAGFGRVGNDLMGVGSADFADDLVRERDVEQAQSLLKAAGHEGLTVPLKTANAAPGYTQMATLFAQQASDAGVKIQVQSGDSSTYFSSPDWPYPMGEDNFTVMTSLSVAYNYTFVQYDDTLWGFDKDMAAASAAYPQSKELWRKVQETQFNKGGFIVPVYTDNLDALGEKVNGIPPSPVGYLNGWNISDAWLA